MLLSITRGGGGDLSCTAAKRGSGGETERIEEIGRAVGREEGRGVEGPLIVAGGEGGGETKKYSDSAEEDENSMIGELGRDVGDTEEGGEEGGIEITIGSLCRKLLLLLSLFVILLSVIKELVLLLLLLLLLPLVLLALLGAGEFVRLSRLTERLGVELLKSL